MIRKRSILQAAVAALALLALVAAPSLTFAEEATLSGEIRAAEYDDDGNVTAVMVNDPEWGSVLILDEGKGAELVNHVGELAEITGEIQELDEESGYDYAISVSAYAIEEPDDDDDPEE